MKYALIGCGRISPNHIVAAQNNNLEIVAVCDIEEQNMHDKKVKFKLADDVHCYVDYLEMLEKEKPELVAIATESGKHAEIAMNCLKKGHSNVIIEKPIALSLSDADRIIEAAREEKLKVCACHQNRFNKSIQKIREAEKDSIIGEFADKQDELLVGTLAMEDARNYYVELGRTRGILPKSEMIPGETVTMGSTIRVYVTKVESNTKGPLILLSRKHYGFVKRLFESEIPELASGDIILHAVAREAGIRSKVAVESLNERIDAIGACIGERGSRIGSILKELNGEKVDIVLYNEDPAEFIKNALSPAKDAIVNITDPVKKEALAIVNDENLSLAIGKKGTNIKLASRLTKYKIEIKTLAQVNEEGNN